MLDRAIQPIATSSSLDDVNERLVSTVQRVTGGPVRSLLSGTWLGHPLHPVLTDLPIGMWTSAFVLDLFGGRAARRPAQAFVGLGVVTALPTAASGLSDWAETTGPARRVGSVHAIANGVGLGAQILSWRARRRGHHTSGVVLSLLGATATTVAAALGGHLVYRMGIGVDAHAADGGEDQRIVT
jgi:uncharacterized membrane protein